MKNKTPKPRVMWAIYDRAAGPVVSGNQTLIRLVEKNAKVKAVRVAIIPLDYIEAIVERACNAHWQEAGGAAWGQFDYRDGIRAALTAAGIPCTKRKARK
jgi:hypothetical protein